VVELFTFTIFQSENVEQPFRGVDARKILKNF
jgi:hypothetical protein